MHARVKTTIGLTLLLLALALVAEAQVYTSPSVSGRGGVLWNQAKDPVFASSVTFGLPWSSTSETSPWSLFQLQMLHYGQSSKAYQYGMTSASAEMVFDFHGHIPRYEEVVAPALRLGLFHYTREYSDAYRAEEGIAGRGRISWDQLGAFIGMHVHGPIGDASLFRLNLMAGAIYYPAMLLEIEFDFHVYRGLSLTLDGQFCGLFPFGQESEPIAMPDTAMATSTEVEFDDVASGGWGITLAGLKYRF